MARLVHAALAVTLCFAVPLAYGQGRGKEPEKGKSEHKSGEKPGEKPGAGGKSEKHDEPGRGSPGKPGPKNEGPGKGSPGGDWSERTHSGKQSNEPTHAGGAAVGHAAEKNKTNQPTGAQGAAANRNPSQVSGAAGAAAGAAAEKNKSPNLTGAQGAAAGAAVANRNSSALSGATGAAAGYVAVRNSFNHPNMYGQQWYGDHPNAWAPARWSAGTAWAPVTWNAVATQVGYANVTPISYNYGDNVTLQNGNVIVDTQSVGTAADFSQQAADLARKGIDADVSGTEQWLSLSVFALVRNENQHPQVILQLAINDQGILRGNYTDEVAGHTLPIQGAVDKQTQRAAWAISGNMLSVMEAGLHNLTESEAPVLIHRNGKTDHWLLVRLEQPKADAN